MAEQTAIGVIHSCLREGMTSAKCRKCGCMKAALENLHSSLFPVQTESSRALLREIEVWVQQMEPIKYACLGCDYCYPAVASNVLNQAFPEAAQIASFTCAFDVREPTWPAVPGEYFAFCEGPGCPVAVSTLASVQLAENLASLRPKERCIVGKTETENIGIEKVIKNTITNPTIRFLVVAGKDPIGHSSGRTLLALAEHGVDEDMKVIGSPGKRPVLRNVTRHEAEAFRRQVQVVDLLGNDVETIIGKIEELAQKEATPHSCQECNTESQPGPISAVPVIIAKEPVRIEMDKAGYFVITPERQRGVIAVEHYSYDDRLLRLIEGEEARSIYSTIIQNGWVTQLSHAAYLGKELAKAELSIKLGFKDVQDGA